MHLRMDVDTTRKKGSHQSSISLEKGEADILLGTQMIAILGFSKCDLGWCPQCRYGFKPSWDLSREPSKLLTQVAGRAIVLKGRSGLDSVL